MNRHIYGLTLFLFIVKIHFLLYWLFFAPINFFSAQEVQNSPVPAIEIEAKPVCHKTHVAKNVGVSLDISSNRLTAAVELDYSEIVLESKELKTLIANETQIRIFDNNLNRTIVFENVSVRSDGKLIILSGQFPSETTWNKKSNYYAQIIFPNSDGSHQISINNQPIPVLMIKGKN